MEFVTHRREDGTFQPLKEHIENVGERAAQFAAAFDAAEHGREAGLLHDIGKYSSKGQKRQRDPEHTAKVDHSSAGAQEAFRRKDPMAAFAVAGHHGGLPDMGGKSAADDGTLFARLNKTLSGGDNPSAWKQEIVLNGAPSMPEWAEKCRDGRVQAMYTRMLFSCLVDADFLIRKPLLRGGYASLEELLQKLQSHVAPWLKEPKNELCAKRSDILRRCLQGGEEEKGLFTLTVPTGGGKTVSSLAFALTHAVRHGMKRVVYVIPYTSIIEQNAKVFAEILGPENVLEHHSQTELADEKGDSETPEARRRRLACENWDAPVIVTTAVQFFESLYAAKTSRCRKLHNLAGSVVIFDEAQTLPVPFLKPCVSAIGELVRHYGVTAVLCTATQPELGRLFNELAPELSIREIALREIAPEPDELFEFFRRVSFQREGQLSNEELAARLTETEQVLCIVNTRKRAREIFQLLPEEGRFHLSTLMTPQDRKRVLDAVRERLKERKPCRVVSTSLVEAGVDVDFPAVWREVAGLDSILQAAGRCNREGKRPAAESIVHIFHADGRIPRMLKLNVAAAESVLADYKDVNTRPAIHAYFQTLLWAKGDAALDEKNILQSESSFAFRRTAEQFHLIDANTVTIYIPAKADAADIQALRDGQFSKALLRRLSRGAVNLYAQECSKLAEGGAVELHADDGYAILLNEKLYSDECGLEIGSEGGEGFFA